MDVFNELINQLWRIVWWIYETIITAFLFLTNLLLEVFKSAFYWGWDQLLTLMTSIINLFSFENDLGIFTSGLSMAGLPAQVVYVLNKIGIDACFTLLITAVLIRVGMNLIPSWATRV